MEVLIFDSLDAATLQGRISSAMRYSVLFSSQSATERVGKVDIIFSHPIISRLAVYLANLVIQRDDHLSAPIHDETAAIQNMLNVYSRDLPRTPSLSDHVVLLTGSTGRLGSHLLQSLLCDTRVAQIYALNRQSLAAKIADRQAVAFSTQRFSVGSLSSPKLLLLDADTSAEHFGLDPDMYDKVRITTLPGVKYLIVL